MSTFAQDMTVKAAWGLTLDQWNRASNKQRAYWWDNLTSAPHFEEVAR